MKTRHILAGALCVASAAFVQNTNAQIGTPFIHDPSTIMECNGKYYTFGTGGGGLISEDGWTWNGGAERPGGGAAPDAIKIGDRYLIAYSTTGGGLGGGHAGKVVTMWNKTLDPKSPDFKFTDPIEVGGSEYDEDCDAIDAGLLLDPTDGRLWLSYGTYFGFIRLIELDPKTGKRVDGNKAIDVAIDCEATDLIYRNGWYYLLGTHGTCCDGANSTYNIVCGRSRKVTGPYVDNVGRDMIHGGGKMVVDAEDRRFGAGHFGREIITDGIEKMSFHFEADLDMSGYSTLAIRPIIWKNDWPTVGENIEDGVYEISSERRGYALELSVDFTRAQGGMRWFNRDQERPIERVNNQVLADVQNTFPSGVNPVRMNEWMNRPHQRWQVVAVPEKGGYLGGPYFKIVVEGTNRALAATAEAEVVTVPEYTGADEQLWRIDQCIDGTYRIMPKSVPGHNGEELVLYSIGDSTPTLAKFDFNNDNSKWNFRKK